MIHTVALSAQTVRVLKTMHGGGSLESRRTFPFPHEYILGKNDGTKYAGKIAVTAVAEMVEHKLVTAHPRDKMGDFVRYDITDAGRKVAETGTLTYDDQHPEIFQHDESAP